MECVDINYGVVVMIESRSLKEYFMDLVREAMRRQRVDTYETTEFYIVNLLSEFVKREKLHGEGDPFGVEPIAFTLLRAFEVSLKERFTLLKRIGDTSLFVSGFFFESLRRRVVGADYYMTIGENAYAHLASLTKWKGDTEVLSTLFQELAEKFIPFVEVLSEVREKTSFTPPDDTLLIYERWFRTKGRKYMELLEKRGIIPLVEPPSENLQ